MVFDTQRASAALAAMERSRHFEELIQEYFTRHAMHGTTHLSIGQEAAQEGLILALSDGDWIVPTHRCHGYTLLRGTPAERMFSEMWGSREGVCKGLGGSMHMTDASRWNLGSSAVVGSGIPIAAGIAYAQKIKRTGSIAVAIFGDGATSRGALHESMNIASLWHLPVLFWCENNGYGMSNPVANAVATDAIACRAEGYRMDWDRVDGNDLIAVAEAAEKAVRSIRENGKPYFVELLTYRQNGHSKSDPCVYRSREEEEAWKKRDPIKLFSEKMVQRGVLTQGEATEAVSEADRQIEKAAKEAERKKDDIIPLSEASSYVLAPEKTVSKTPKGKMHRGSYRRALREAMDEEMSADSSVILLGEDVGRYGGCFKVTGDLWKKHPSQVIDTPVSEEGFTGLAVGAATQGIRPIVEIMYGDFLTLASDPLINHAAKIRFMSAGQLCVPLVLRTPIGSGTGHGAQHTQSLEGMFAGVSGLVVCAPATPADAKGMLKAAVRSDNPVLFCEHKLLYETEGEIGDSEYLVPLGKADVKRKGKDVTLVAYSRAVLTALEAADRLSREKGVEAEVVDLRTLRPLDMATVLASVEKTGRLVMIEESNPGGGYGAQVVSAVCQSGVVLRTAPVLLSGLDIPVPFTETLEKQMVPTAEDIVRIF